MVTGTLLALYVIGAWWGATGLLLYLVRRPRRAVAATLFAGSTLAVLGALLLRWSSQSTTLASACLAFAASLVIWGWIELSFLLGVVTGPRRTACAAGCHGAAHFKHAVQAILHHELATIAAAALVWALSWHAANLTGLWTFLLLWGMRISAKLNLFLGVPNTGEIMLPPHLKYLGAFFRHRRMNLLFPISITLITLLCVQLFASVCSAPEWDFASVQTQLLAVLAALGWFEHWMLLLPIRADAPWKFTRAAARASSRAS